MRKVNIALAILLLLVGVPWYWLLIDNRPGDAQAKPITIAQLRALATSLPGPAPSLVERESPAFRRLPGALFAAGTGIKRVQIGVVAYRLTVPGGRPIVIDSGLTRREAEEMGMEFYDPQSQARIEAALREAGMVLITHEHLDHQGALVDTGGAVLAEAARLNAAQLPPSPLAATLRWRDGAVPQPRITGSAPQAVAPGVVVLPAPSHTPGSQLIFVRLADGRELLFAGDIATVRRSWSEIRARSRLVGDWLAPEDRREVYSWLRTIAELKRQAPGLVVVPGHDLPWLNHNVEARLIRRGFGGA